MTLRKHIMALMVAIAAGCCYGFAAEKSFRIVFADNGTTLKSNSALNYYTVNNNLSTYISEGSEYIENFATSSIKYCYRAQKGMGWIIGALGVDSDKGQFTINLSESGQVNVKKINVSITATANKPHWCAIIINSSTEEVKSGPSIDGKNATLSYTFSGEKLRTLYLSNGQNGFDTVYGFYLHYIEVVYEEAEAADPEMQSDEGSFASATSGTEFDFAGSRLRFDNIVDIENGAAMFNTDNRLTVSAPDGYFLAGIEFAGASAEGSITASSGSVTAGKWLPAEGDIALNAVEFTAGSAESLTGVKINYLPFRIDHSQVLSTIDFTTTEGAANSINIHSSFANSNKSTVESFIIRANGVQIAETQSDATEATFTALPYLTDGRLTISPVINGSERQPELLEGTALPNLAT